MVLRHSESPGLLFLSFSTSLAKCINFWCLYNEAMDQTCSQQLQNVYIGQTGLIIRYLDLAVICSCMVSLRGLVSGLGSFSWGGFGMYEWVSETLGGPLGLIRWG